MMNEIYGLAGLALASTAFKFIILPKMKAKWLKTLDIVCEAVEKIEDVHDFVAEKDQDKFERFMKKLKRRIDARLVTEGGDKKNIDKVLKDKGLLNKSGHAD